MTAPVERYRAGQLTYPGNVEHIVGEVKGPGNNDDLVVAVQAVYDPAGDVTVVEFDRCTDADYAQLAETRVARLEVDPW